MRSSSSVYVDVGYLLASAATRATGTSLRSGIHVDFRALIASILAEVEQASGLPVMRLHWYDSAKNGVPDLQQERIGELPKVKLRLGRFGVDGQQKGVDLRIGLDLVTHARNGAAEVFFLISGDDDLTEAVEEAQVHGVQVVVLAVPTTDGKPHGVSRHLLRAADDLTVLAGDLIDAAVMKVEVAPPAEEVAPTTVVPAKPAATPTGAAPKIPSPRDVASMIRPTIAREPAAALAYTAETGSQSTVMPGYEAPDDYDDQIESVVSRVLASFRQSASPESIVELRNSKPSIPRDVDRALLIDAAEALDMSDISEPIRHRLRQRFWEQFERGM